MTYVFDIGNIVVGCFEHNPLILMQIINAQTTFVLHLFPLTILKEKELLEFLWYLDVTVDDGF